MDGRLGATAVLLAVLAVLVCLGGTQSDLPPDLGQLQCNDTCAILLNSTSVPFPDHNPFRRLNVCACDDQCSQFGDCCRDAPLASASSRPLWQCFPVIHDRRPATWVKQSCNFDWSGSDEIRNKCEDDVDSVVDPNGKVPVTSPSSGVSYRNIHCAVCNDDHDGAIRWNVSLDCGEIYALANMSDGGIRQNIELNPEKTAWGIWFTPPGEERMFFSCDLQYKAQNLSDLYSCVPVVSKCQSSWSGTQLERDCLSYTSAVGTYGVTYRNPHCLACNNITGPPQMCGLYPDHGSISPRGFSFSILMDVNQGSGNIVGKVSLCSGAEVYDPFYKTCRNVICGDDDYVLVEQKCMRRDGSTPPTDGRSLNESTYSSEYLDCRKTALKPTEYVMRSNGNLYALRYDRVFTPRNFRLVEGDGGVAAIVCVVFNASNDISKFSSTMGYVSAVGLGVSISCLFAHLAVFALVPDVRNLSGRNLASLALSLLAAYLCFLLGQLGNPSPEICKGLAISTYYFFLASFFWMSAMAFDVWRTLRAATRELRVSSGSQWRRFFAYCLAAWFLPSIIVGIAVFLDGRSAGIPEEFRPLFGRYGCWFGQRKALLIFFAGPAGALMLLNITLFTSTAVMVIGSTKTSVKRSGSAARRNFSLYVRLSVMMGLSWTLGLVAGYMDVEVLWYLFIIFNTLEGLFIFVAFSCTHKVGGYIRDHVLACAKQEPYRSATLSSGSGYNSNNSTGTTNSGFSRRGSPRSSTNYKRTAPYLAKKTNMDMY